MSEGCRSCTGRCCYDVVVHVTPFDVRRIGCAHALAPLDIVESREVDEQEEISNTIFGVMAADAQRRVRPVLRKSILNTNACQFLMQIGTEHQRCGIYPDRPRVCAIYPFQINHGTVDLRQDVRCGPGDWNLARLDYAGIRRELAVFTAEWHATARIVEVWNEALERESKASSFDAFIIFADAVASRVLSQSNPRAEFLGRWGEASLASSLEREGQNWLDSVTMIARSALDG